MRSLQACIHINAPVQTVRDLADAQHRSAWLVIGGYRWVRTVDESWEATECEGGTRLSMQLRYQSRVPFIEPLLTDGFPHQVVSSLNRLKAMAETAIH